MGTNFYLYLGDIGAFDPDDALHIGKRSGPRFSFQGHRWDDTGETIRSWADWAATIRLHRFVVSEYGEALDAETFIGQVESTTVEDRYAQHRWMLDHVGDPVTASMLRDCWADDERYSFTWRDFS